MGWLLPAMTAGEARQPARRGEEREAPGREPALRQEPRPAAGADVPRGPPLLAGRSSAAWRTCRRPRSEDVSEFFRLYYAPNNASLCVAGDFDPAQAKEWIAKYFGPIPPGRPVDRLESWIPQLDGERRALAEDAVELPRLYMQWHSPGWYQPGDAEFDLLARHRRLGQDLAPVQDAGLREADRAGRLRLAVLARDERHLRHHRHRGARPRPGRTRGGHRRRAARAAGQGRHRPRGRTWPARASRPNAVRELQQIGGFGGKADRLNRYNVLVGDPGWLQADLARYDRGRRGLGQRLAAAVHRPRAPRRALDRAAGQAGRRQPDVDRSQLPDAAPRPPPSRRPPCRRPPCPTD